MAISSNASRIQVQTTAKSGTLGAQGALSANQIKFDTAITTNNGNLAASPTFDPRHVILREGEVDEEVNVITSVNVDGLTCDCFHDWDSAPQSGDTYDIGYTFDDVATVTGCTKDSTSLEFDFDRKLQVGQNSATLAFLGMANYQVARLHDNGNQESLEVINGSRFDMGSIRGDVTSPGGTLIFSNDGDGEIVMQVRNGATFNAHDSSFIAARASDGINLTVSIIAGGILNWSQVNLLGITAPMTTVRGKFQDYQAVQYGTVSEILASPPLAGHMPSEFDLTLKNFLTGKPSAAKVFVIVEDPDL